MCTMTPYVLFYLLEPLTNAEDPELRAPDGPAVGRHSWSESKVARQPDGAAMMANVNHQRAFFGDLVSWSPRGDEVYGHHMIPKFACDYDLKVCC